MVGIYKLVSPSGKIYIGQSRNIERRMYSYYSSPSPAQTKLYNAIVKYKFENFTIVYLKIIHYYLPEDTIQKILDKYETYYIKMFNSITKGYNIRDGGARGKLNESSKLKISEANKNRIFSEEHKLKLSESHKGYIMSEEQRKKISIKSKSKGISKETRLKMVESRRGYKPTKDTLEKYSKSHIKNKVIQYDLEGNFIKEWDCAVQAAKELNYTISCIYTACKKFKTYKGYKWEYSSFKPISYEEIKVIITRQLLGYEQKY